jgi:hypothetical protein
MKRSGNVSQNLKKLYEEYPGYFSAVELVIYSGWFVFYLWIVPFWFWGIHRLDMPFPEVLRSLFFGLWHEKVLARVISTTLVLGVFAISFFIRHDSLKDLGIRFDNFRKSGRECLIVTCLLIFFLIVFASVFYSGQFFPNKLFNRSATHYLVSVPVHVAWGIIQQFILQCIIFLRLSQIFGKRLVSIGGSTALFALAHSPNVDLMILTFCFGSVSCLLFTRHRNIFTLGIMHGIVHMALRMSLSALLVSGAGYYDFNLRIGPFGGDPKLFAHVEYRGSIQKANPGTTMTVPVFVTNRSSVAWDSRDKKHPVFISYHLFDSKGSTVEYDNIRTPFDRAVKPGESLKVDLVVQAPSKKGEYSLEVDIVKERIAWFKEKGSTIAVVPLIID